MYEWLELLHLENPHLIKALLAGLLVSTVCGVIGCFIVLRGTAFLADAVAHAMLAGVVCGYLVIKKFFGLNEQQDAQWFAVALLVGSVIAGFITVGLVAFVSHYSRVKESAIIGIMYTGVFAVGGLLASLNSADIHIDLLHFVTGQVLAVNDAKLWVMAAVTGSVIAVVILFFRSLQLITFDRVMAASIGVPVVALDYLLTTCTSLVVVSGVSVVGVILVVGLLITPAATAYLLCDRLWKMITLSAVFGWTSFLAGYAASEFLSVAPGSSIVVAASLQFMIVFVVAPRYGLLADWMRRRKAIPQQVVEDVLGSVLRGSGQQVPLATVLDYVEGRDVVIRRAVRSLKRQELLTVEGEMLGLTSSGVQEARRLLRAHRLWETYLEHLGMPGEELHGRAHQLEHVHGEAVVDYLDDKLGHPLTDPHGSEIPEDFVDLVSGRDVPVAILREGNSGEVIKVNDPGLASQLPVGTIIHVGPRRDQEQTWIIRFSLPGNDNPVELELDHDGADAIIVRLH
jgi:manganese/iron transport system permease protein/iron/zinc/copper transport system permease protein